MRRGFTMKPQGRWFEIALQAIPWHDGRTLYGAILHSGNRHHTVQDSIVWSEFDDLEVWEECLPPEAAFNSPGFR